MKSAFDGQHGFARTARADIQRSSFNRSFGHKTTFDGGLLIPIFADEALPGDTFNVRMHTFARLATPLHPVLDNMHLDSFFFAVPIRLLWDNWQKFNGEQVDPGDSTDFLVPQLSTGVVTNDISDYLGIPIEATNLDHSALWHRAYNLIFNEWFRDENLVDSLVVQKDDGPDVATNYTLQRRGKRHDYFTSCLPWPQKGDSVELPLGDTAPLTLDASTRFIEANGNPTFGVPADETGLKFVASSGNAEWDIAPSSSDSPVPWKDPSLKLSVGGITGTVDLSSATAATINQLRQAFQIQRLYERDARGGSRYTEIVRSHFGVVSPDQRLQRPEYLGGGSQNISVTPVPQTSSTDGTSPQGNLAAYGVSTGSNHAFQKSFTEHCIILGIICVRADLNYQQGLPRMFSRRTRWDFYWPSLAHLGEQAVLNKEIYAVGDATPGQDDLVFGYQERFAEYRYKPSQITRQFRSTDATSLDTWHLAQEFTALPALNEAFIEENPPIDRIIAVTSEPHFLFDAFFDFKCARPMPTFSTPGMIDHF